jgi:hypothetical protein
MQHGGVVGAARNVRNTETITKATHLTQPEKLGVPSGMGVVSGGVRGIQGFEQGGPIPPPVAAVQPMQGSSGGLVDQGAQIIGGAQAGQNSANQAVQMQRTGVQYNQDQNARGAARAEADYRTQIVELHRDWDANSLDDKGVPKNSRGIQQGDNNPLDTPAQLAVADKLPGGPNGQAQAPAGAAPAAPSAPAPAGNTGGAGLAPAPAPASGASGAAPSVSPVQAAATTQAVQGAAANPGAQAGLPEESPTASGKAHSLTAEQWANWDVKIEQAAAAAAGAGHDPAAVRDALYASRNAFVQGHILRNLSAANVALLNGDQANVEKALRDANYYLPNGQDLKIQKQDGQLVYQDPISPYLLNGTTPTYAARDPATGKPNQPNMIPVDAAHIQQLGTAFLDPQNVQNTILATRSSYAKMQLDSARAQGALMSGQGRADVGAARLTEANTNAGVAPSKIYSNIAHGDQAEAYAARQKFLSNAQPKLDPQLQRQSEAAAGAVDELALGPKTVQPDMIAVGKDRNGVVQMGPNPNAGRTTFDTARAAPSLKGANQQTITSIKGIAQDIYVSNQGQMPANAAAAKAVQLYEQSKQTHPEGTKQVPNVMINRAQGAIHVWDPQAKKWGVIRLSQYGAGRMADAGIDNVVEPPPAEGGSSGIPSNDATDASVIAEDSSERDTDAG